MITINLSPIRYDRVLALEAHGTALVFNGQAIDLATYDPDAAPCEWIIGTVARDGDDFTVTVLAPYGEGAPQSALWPVPITVAVNGPITLPSYIAPEGDA